MAGWLLAVLLAACGGAEGASLDVDDAAGATPPPRDAELVEAEWPDVAAWIQRENAAGRPVVVNFFASWCGPCKAEAPVLRAAAAEHDDVAFLGIDYKDQLEAARRFVEEEQLGFPTLRDFDGSIGTVVGARGMPTTAFFDRDGTLKNIHTGVLTEELLEERLAELDTSPDV